MTMQENPLIVAAQGGPENLAARQNTPSEVASPQGNTRKPKKDRLKLFSGSQQLLLPSFTGWAVSPRMPVKTSSSGCVLSMRKAKRQKQTLHWLALL